MAELVDHNHSLTLTADGKAFCSCGEKFKVDPENVAATIDAWERHLEIPDLLEELAENVREEHRLRYQNEAAIKRLAELGLSSTAISKAIGVNGADDKLLMSPSTIQRIAKEKLVQSPRRRRR